MLPAEWSISPTPGTPLPFTNLRPFVPESWVIGSILLPSCARLPIRKLTLGKTHAPLKSPSVYRIRIESQAQDQGGRVSTWDGAGHAVNGLQGSQRSFSPPCQ